MTSEEPELLTIHDFTTLFYVILTGKSFECLESSTCIESDLGICNMKP